MKRLGAGDVDSVTMHFYNNLLKEFWVDTRERRVTPDRIERELQARDSANRRIARSKSGKPGDESLGLGRSPPPAASKAGADREKKLAAFPYRVDISWSDDQTRAEASIYYTSEKPELCTSLLTMHISAAQWLNNNRPQLGPSPATSLRRDHRTPSTRPTQAPAPAEPPKRLFPSP